MSQTGSRDASAARSETAAVVAASQNGNPNVLTEFATFELHPWEDPGGFQRGSAVLRRLRLVGAALGHR